MKYPLVQIIVAASSSDGESTFWMQMLAMVVLAGLLGVGGLVKARAAKSRYGKPSYPGSVHGPYFLRRWNVRPFKVMRDKYLAILSRAVQREPAVQEAVTGFEDTDIAGGEQQEKNSAKERDLAGGMELLDVDFLVGVVENTKANDRNDVMMRRLGFNELVRRERVSAVDSIKLKVYATDKRRVYGKDIQCEALKELAKRTGSRPLSHVRVP
ncbi:MAG: hypothetical protein ACYSUC_00300 [Planctomycetota bacterium]|jgi:hypothetical protein